MSKPVLTAKQKTFADYYMTDPHGTKAAREAGYSGDDNALAVIAHRNLRNAKIRSYIDEVMERDCIGKAETLWRLSTMARGDITGYINQDTGIIDLKHAKQTHLIKKMASKVIITERPDENGVITTRTTEITRIELYDAKDALKTIARIHGLLKDTVVVETWQDKAIEAIRNGSVNYDALERRFGSELAQNLFARAGVVYEGL